MNIDKLDSTLAAVKVAVVAAGGADGIFGKKTGDALEIYQKENKDADGKQLEHDREAGEKTWGSMLGQ